jgi:hypothetical protein
MRTAIAIIVLSLATLAAGCHEDAYEPKPGDHPRSIAKRRGPAPRIEDIRPPEAWVTQTGQVIY